MGKKKDKPQIVNNIQELNLEIDYDRLAEALVEANRRATEKEREKNREPIKKWIQSKGYKDYTGKKGFKNRIFSVLNPLLVFCRLTFSSPKKDLDGSMLNDVTKGITAGIFHLTKFTLWLLTIGLFAVIFYHPNMEFNIWYAIICLIFSFIAFLLSGIFNIMAIEVEQMNNGERVLGVLSAVLSIAPIVKKVLSILIGGANG